MKVDVNFVELIICPNCKVEILGSGEDDFNAKGYQIRAIEINSWSRCD